MNFEWVAGSEWVVNTHWVLRDKISSQQKLGLVILFGTIGITKQSAAFQYMPEEYVEDDDRIGYNYTREEMVYQAGPSNSDKIVTYQEVIDALTILIKSLNKHYEANSSSNPCIDINITTGSSSTTT